MIINLFFCCCVVYKNTSYLFYVILLFIYIIERFDVNRCIFSLNLLILCRHDREIGSIDEAHEGMVWCMAWHPLGHVLVTGSNDHTTLESLPLLSLNCVEFFLVISKITMVTLLSCQCLQRSDYCKYLFFISKFFMLIFEHTLKSRIVQNQ